MPMRQECKHFESRTYGNGDTVRKCNLDLAPDAPWRCPDNCSQYARRPDAGWSYGSLVPPRTPSEPPGLDDGSAAAILEAAEEILNQIGPEVVAEVEATRRKSQRSRWRRLGRRKDR